MRFIWQQSIHVYSMYMWQPLPIIRNYRESGLDCEILMIARRTLME